jgi:hypothetical protein
MDRKAKPLPDTSVTFTVRLSPTLIKRTKLAATLFEESVQTIVSRALEEWLKKHETTDQGLLLIRYARKLAAMKEAK